MGKKKKRTTEKEAKFSEETSYTIHDQIREIHKEREEKVKDFWNIIIFSKEKQFKTFEVNLTQMPHKPECEGGHGTSFNKSPLHTTNCQSASQWQHHQLGSFLKINILSPLPVYFYLRGLA